MLSEYQYEALGWMLSRETSAYALEDLYELALGPACVLTLLPGGGATARTSPRERHRGGILAEVRVPPVDLVTVTPQSCATSCAPSCAPS